MGPLVTAVIPTRNRQAKLLRFLEQFLAQTYDNLRLVVVDANSTDGTREAIASHYPQITLVPVGDGCYWTGSTNRGIQVALQQGTDYILTINDDSVVQPNHVARLVDLATRHQVPILGNRIDYLATPGLVWSLGTYTRWGTADFLRLAYCDVRVDQIPAEVLSQELIAVDALPGNGVLIQRQVFETVGLYNETFLPHYHADSELIMRAKQRGFSAWIAPGIALQNDFSVEQKRFNLKSPAGFLYAFFHKRSHLFMPPVFYILWRYCPRDQLWATLQALAGRLLKPGA